MSERTSHLPASFEPNGSVSRWYVKGIAPQMVSVKIGCPASRLAGTGYDTTLLAPQAAPTAAPAATSRDRSAHGG